MGWFILFLGLWLYWTVKGIVVIVKVTVAVTVIFVALCVRAVMEISGKVNSNG